MSPKRKIIGVATPRSEGREKVTGKAIYATDVAFPGMLWAKVLRSPIPYGRIKRVDTRKAAALPGVRAGVTGEDAGGRLIGRKIYTCRCLPARSCDEVAAVAVERGNRRSSGLC